MRLEERVVTRSCESTISHDRAPHLCGVYCRYRSPKDTGIRAEPKGGEKAAFAKMPQHSRGRPRRGTQSHRRAPTDISECLGLRCKTLSKVCARARARCDGRAEYAGTPRTVFYARTAAFAKRSVRCVKDIARGQAAAQKAC